MKAALAAAFVVFGVRRARYTGAMHTSKAAMFGDDKTTIEVGATGEDRAVAHLVRSGMRIVERNYRCRLGELDIVARDGGMLVFVEVRSRRSAEFGSALEAVHWQKRRKVTRVAMMYLAVRKPRFECARFDVVAITGDTLEHIKDAWRL